MSLQRIHTLLVLLTVTSCQPQSPNNFADQGIYFNLRDYYYPAYKLLEPTVYCYADSTGEIKMYMQHHISINGTDSTLVTWSYDSAFILKAKSAEIYGDSGIYLGTMEVGRPGKLLVKGSIDSGFTAWQQPLQSDSISFFYSFTLTNGTITLRSDMSGYFTEVSDSIQTMPYRREDCVLMHTFYKGEAGGPFLETETMANNANMVYAKGVGMIYSQEPNGGKMTKYYLQKIAPASEFPALTQK